MSENKVIIGNAILITAMIGGLFFGSMLLGLEENSYLRFLNLVFVVFGIKRAIKTNVLINKEENYIVNLGIGIQTSTLAVILSILGVLFYVEVINPKFLTVLSNCFLLGGNLTMPEIVFSLAIEGIASSVIGSFIIMQYYKKHNKLSQIRV